MARECTPVQLLTRQRHVGTAACRRRSEERRSSSTVAGAGVRLGVGHGVVAAAAGGSQTQCLRQQYKD
jgi:hypothetical protein